MTDKPKPSAYRFCELHMKPSTGPARCAECFGPVANPVNDEPVHKVNTLGSVTTNDSENENPGRLSIVEPVLTDPDAQKIVEAAHSYARAKETVKLIIEQVREANELVDALKKKLKETTEIMNAAQNELREATKTT